MGFSAPRAVAALEATGGGDPQEAALWLLERGGGEQNEAASEERERERETRRAAAAASASASSVGVGGLLRREAASAAAADAALESAFSDLGALMRAAAEMVELAKKYREEAKGRGDAESERQRKKEGVGVGGVGGGGALSSSSSPPSAAETTAADFEDELALLGVIASPVTRAATETSSSSSNSNSSSPSRFSLTGRKSSNNSTNPRQHLSLFIRELSAELSDFCQPLVAAAGGVLPLTDVYCLYNRARGSELAAPLDVVAAAEAWGALYGEGRAPLRLRRLGEGGGVLAVAQADQDDGAVCELLAALARGEEAEEEQDEKNKKNKKPDSAVVAAARARLLPATFIKGLGRPLTPSDVAAAMRVPLPIAAAHLATAESAGVLCRDDGEEGVRHFWNFFATSAASVDF